MTLLWSAIDLIHDEFVQLGAFTWMVWNGALALIPVLLSILFFKREDQPRKGLRTFTFFFEILIVLLFLPNAPYIATDLIHFLETVRITDGSLWHLLGTEFPLYAGFVLFGLVCYAFSVDRLLFALRMRLGSRWRMVGLFAIPLLSALGIYLGRVARFNSWDILTEPRAILHSSRTVIDHLRFLKIVGAMWMLLILVHQVYKVFHDGVRYRLSGLEEHRTKRRTTLDRARQTM